MKNAGNNAGIVIGITDTESQATKIYSKGAIKETDELKLVCPASKPIISYILLKENLDLNSTIKKEFPKSDGYKIRTRLH